MQVDSKLTVLRARNGGAQVVIFARRKNVGIVSEVRATFSKFPV